MRLISATGAGTDSCAVVEYSCTMSAATSPSAQFTEAEHWLDWAEPRSVIQRKVTALNIIGPGNAKAMLGGQAYAVDNVEPLVGNHDARAPGTLLARDADHLTVCAADGALRVVGRPLGT